MAICTEKLPSKWSDHDKTSRGLFFNLIIYIFVLGVFGTITLQKWHNVVRFLFGQYHQNALTWKIKQFPVQFTT